MLSKIKYNKAKKKMKEEKEKEEKALGLRDMKPEVGICNHLTGRGVALTLFPWKPPEGQL